MPAPATIDAFLGVLAKSGLVDSARLHRFLQLHRDSCPTPRILAVRMVAAGLLTHFQAEQLLLGKHRGYTLGKYRILERIGTGGHSTVYLAEHQVVKRRVAIKVLPTARSENPTALARFYREARAAGALDHPNLVKAHDIDQDSGLHFLVMEYVDGTSLQEIILRGGPLSVERAAHYIQQAAQGLQAAHAAGLVHRDIKPANILLDRRGMVRVLDLGLARFCSDQTDPLTVQFDNNNVLGTADYVAPEQALNSHEVDIRADIYSLGATFYFLLTGQSLFPTGKATQKLIWHQTRQPTPLRQLRPDVPEELALVVERMIEKDRERRYQTPAEVSEALKPWTATPIPPPSEKEMPRLSPAARATLASGSEASLHSTNRARRGERGAPTVTQFELPPQSSLYAAAPAPRRPRFMAEMPTPSVGVEQMDTSSGEGSPSQVPTLDRQTTTPVEPIRRSPPASRAKAKKASRKARPRTSGRLLSSILLLLIGAFTGIGIRLVMNGWSTPAADPGPEGIILLVSHSPGDFASLSAALKAAPSGARILVREPVWEEALHVEGDTMSVRNLSIEGRPPSGSAVLWRPPAGHSSECPLLQIAGGAGLTVKGFTLDGEDRVNDLVALTGPSAGLILEDLQLQGFRKRGIVLSDCTGSDELPIRLQRLLLTSRQTAASAIVLEARNGDSNRHVRLLDCRLEGPNQSTCKLHHPARHSSE